MQISSDENDSGDSDSDSSEEESSSEGSEKENRTSSKKPNTAAKRNSNAKPQKASNIDLLLELDNCTYSSNIIMLNNYFNVASRD